MHERHCKLFLSKSTALCIKFTISCTVLAHEKCRRLSIYVDIIRLKHCNFKAYFAEVSLGVSNFVETFCKKFSF